MSTPHVVSEPHVSNPHIVSVTDSDVSFASILLHDKSHRGIRRAALISIPVVFAIVLAEFSSTNGAAGLLSNMGVALGIAGYYALWLGALAYTVYDARACLRLGIRGKVIIALALAVPAAFLLWIWGTRYWMTAIFYAMIEPFAYPVMTSLFMLITGFFTRSPLDGDEELSRAIHDVARHDATGKGGASTLK